MPAISCRRLLTPLLLLLAAQGCAHRTAGEARHRCLPAVVDPSYARFGAVYTACDVDRPATPEPIRGPSAEDRAEAVSSVPARGTSGQCRSAIVEFVVDEEGRAITESARVVRATDAAYGESVIRSLTELRFKPATKGGLPVRQVTQFGRASGTTVVVVRGGPGGSMPTAPVRAPRAPRC